MKNQKYKSKIKNFFRKLAIFFLSAISLVTVYHSLFNREVFAQVDPNLDTRLQSGPIIVDHTSIPLFDQIPDVYIVRAQNIRMMWGDRSVGGNISDGLVCLSYESDEVAPSRCKGYTHNWPQFASPQSWVNWYRAGGYNRSNWTFFFDPGLGVTPELSCSGSNGMWDGLVGCFIEHVRNNVSQYDAFSYQHSYLTIMPGSNIANPTTGYFVNQTSKTDIYDYEKLEPDFPTKAFFYWTTSLSRSLGSQEGTDYNNQMRQWAQTGHKILFDVADIESHTPTGNNCYDNRDGVEYCSSSTSTNCENYPDDSINQPAICQNYTTETDGGHLYSSMSVMMGKMYWVLMAQIAGWNPGQVGPSPTPQPTLSPTPRPTNTPTPPPASTPTPIRIPGDANGDGRVDEVDYQIWFNHYDPSISQSGGTLIGDFNLDSKVNGLDYVIWLNNYGT